MLAGASTSMVKKISISAIALISGEQLRGARAMIRMDQTELATRANVSVETIKRMERTTGVVSANVATLNAVVCALESAGVEFIAENGGGAGVRLAKQTPGSSGMAIEDLNASNDE